MAEVVRMPKLSDTMTEGVIAQWHKKVGDKVKSGDLLADIETDKATMEFESFQDGVLLHIGVEEKQPVPVDSIIAILGKEGEDISDLLKDEGGSKKADSKEEAKKESGSDDTKKDSGKKDEPEKDASKEEKDSDKDSEKTGSKDKSDTDSKDSKPAALPDGVEVVRMPKLSDTMTEGVVAKWHKKVGDKVKSGDLLADIETDKATMEFESFQDGVLLHLGVEEGKSVPVDSVLAILGKGGEDVKAIIASLGTGKSQSSSADTKDKKEDSDKKEDTEKKSEDKSGDKSDVTKSDSQKQEPKTQHSSDSRIKASPLAKAMAREKGIDIGQVNGSGDNGRITKHDVESFTPSTAKVKSDAAKASTGANNAALGEESFTDEPVSQMRKTIARRLLESTTGAPVFYLNIEVDMDNAMAARAAINDIPDTKISFNDLVIKACAAALRKHPKVNSSWMTDKIRVNHHIHIGMAVAVEDGLLVPVIRFADQKSLSQIGNEAKDLGKRARDKKLQPADWEGNTFTVSNLGMFGIESFTSIINSPASCILSVGAIRQVPVVKNNMVVPGNTMMLTLACDHRTVDGATGAAFLQTLKIFIENPVTILA